MKWLDRLLTWKCPLLPTLQLSQWWCLWHINFAGFVIYWLGVWFGWWAFFWLGHWFTFVFFLLAFTPMDFTRVFYIVRMEGDTDEEYHIVSRFAAQRARRDPAMEVHRIWVKGGEILRGEQLK